METPTATSSAEPSQPAAAPAPTISATRDAANRGDFSTFAEARHAAKSGKPLAPVSVDRAAAPPSGADATPLDTTRAVSEKDRKADERMRRAVEDGTRELNAEIARLKAQLAERTADRSAAPVTPPQSASEPAYKRFRAMPDAPKLQDFDSIEDHAAAMSHFVAEKLLAEQRDTSARTDQQKQERAQYYEREQRRIASASKQIEDHRAAHPDFLKDVPEDVRATLKSLQPFGSLPTDANGNPQGGGAANAVGELLFDSAVVPAMYEHWVAHPEDLAKLLNPPAGLDRVPADRRLHAWIGFIRTEFYRQEGWVARNAAGAITRSPAESSAISPSPISAAPPPPSTLSRPNTVTDPKAAAVKRGDFETFTRIRQEERNARRRPA